MHSNDLNTICCEIVQIHISKYYNRLSVGKPAHRIVMKQRSCTIYMRNLRFHKNEWRDRSRSLLPTIISIYCS